MVLLYSSSSLPLKMFSTYIITSPPPPRELQINEVKSFQSGEIYSEALDILELSSDIFPHLSITVFPLIIAVLIRLNLLLFLFLHVEKGHFNIDV